MEVTAPSTKAMVVSPLTQSQTTAAAKMMKIFAKEYVTLDRHKMRANEYLTKPFLEPELLEMLNNLLLLRAQAITASGPIALQPALV